MKKLKKVLCLLMTSFILAGCIDALPSRAGRSAKIINEDSYKEALDETAWSNPDGDISIQGSTIQFSQDSTEATRLISRSDVVASQQLDVMMKAEFLMNFSQLPQGEKFIFGMGLPSVEALPGEEGNLEVAFSNNDGLTVRVDAYETADDAVSVMKEVSCGSVKGNTRVSVSLYTSGKLMLTVNGRKLYDADIPVTGEGSVGFLQTGSCAVSLSNINIELYRYDRPENCEIFEDFEKGEFNTEWFSAAMISRSKYLPSVMEVVDYHDSKVLMFQNVGQGYLITKHQYSNFELTFDLPYIQRETIVDEDGNVISPISESFGVSYGGDTGGNDNYKEVEYVNSGDLLLFMGSSVMGYLTDNPASGAKNHDYWEADCEKTPTIKVSAIDGVVNVSVKWTDEEDSAYETMMTYTLDGSPTGYIGIWAPSGTCSSFAIDNVRIKNLDKDANLIDVGYEGSKIEVPVYNYEPEERVYRETESEEETDEGYRYLLYVAGLCVIVIGATAGITAVVRKKNRKGVAEDEQKV